ncbi:proton-translocating transhydrogenase family protein [uncultured Sunxiuqinia sp.]|uniref:proton-translocating transhydrogenase family protein n=1 Tax=uncultured Sunxiuqinia sp. TaxID=1573825 RepID=UPI002AA782FD|nr:proton-translocating transhydrogenase family protein [uncultured Sunxiuqinia sp.]
MHEILIFFYTYKEAIFIIALSIFLGIEVISNVPAVLHTPLMSGANAISGVILSVELFWLAMLMQQPSTPS